MTTQHHKFAELMTSAGAPGESGIVGAQLVALYREAVARSEPTILELGTENGASTTMFLQAAAENGGRVVSVDIEDCSMVSDSERWTFVQADSTDVQTITTAAPTLGDGIDVLYVDSLHTRSHVEAEVAAWWPYLKEGAVVFFDDVDAALVWTRPRCEARRSAPNVVATGPDRLPSWRSSPGATSTLRNLVEPLQVSMRQAATVNVSHGGEGLYRSRRVVAGTTTRRPRRHGSCTLSEYSDR